jgi:NAD-dependent DNA ligase
MKDDLDDRQIDELIGLSRGICADGAVNQKEAEYLEKWLIANKKIIDNPIIATLYKRVKEMLSDNVLDSEEANELFEALHNFNGGEFEFGEILKATKLPLDIPPPDVVVPERNFCFTGTFAYGSRSFCQNAILEKGGQALSKVTQKLDYLVIGIYATDSWAHSSYGRKIEQAMEYRDRGFPVAMISEDHWVKFV